MPKPLAKSLHTVSVLVNVATALKGNGSIESAMQQTVVILGYDGADDPYDLIGKALAQMNKAR